MKGRVSRVRGRRIQSAAIACKELHRNGFAPVAFDNLSEGQAEFVKWGDLIEATSAVPTRSSLPFLATRPVAAIHFAAHAYVGQSVQEPSVYYSNNVSGSLNVAEALRAAGEYR